jgi:hypothetical protein
MVASGRQEDALRVLAAVREEAGSLQKAIIVIRERTGLSVTTEGLRKALQSKRVGKPLLEIADKLSAPSAPVRSTQADPLTYGEAEVVFADYISASIQEGKKEEAIATVEGARARLALRKGLVTKEMAADALRASSAGREDARASFFATGAVPSALTKRVEIPTAKTKR